MKRRGSLGKRSAFDTVSNVLIILFCLLSIFPLYWMVTGSFKYSGDVVKLPPDWFPIHPTLYNYRGVFTNHPAWRWIVNSVSVTLITTAGIVLVSSAAGYALSKMRFIGRRLIFSFVIAALLVPMEVYVLPLYKQVTSYGWRGSVTGAYLAMIVPNLAMPFGVYLMKNFYDTIPDALVEAATLDGCGRTRFFFEIGIPLSKGGIGALAILAGIRIWNNYLWQLLNTFSSKYLYTLPVGVAGLFDTSSGETDYGLRMAAATVSALPLFIIFFSFQRFFTSGITAGAVKE
ncbi:MAG: carbohydrate ABC transporter permease [Clostridia bacterium]|nr:carbohydrate ABC transporter permease [Clostridia bacterium]